MMLYIHKREIEDLHKELIEYATERGLNSKVVTVIFKKPFFAIKYIQSEVNVSYNTAKKYVEIMIESGRIYPDDKKKNKIFRFYDLIDIMR